MDPKPIMTNEWRNFVIDHFWCWNLQRGREDRVMILLWASINAISTFQVLRFAITSVIEIKVTISRKAQTQMTSLRLSFIMPRPHRRGHYKMIAGVCLSVCLSVACLDLTRERTERPRKPKIGRIEAHHTSNQWSYLEVKRLNVKVTRPINAHTVSQCLLNGKADELQTWYTDGARRREDPYHGQVPWPPRSKVKVAGNVVHLTDVGP